LPPPAGGIATWTEAIVQNGLPSPWVASIVDSSITGRTVADHSISLPLELIRTNRILTVTLFFLIFRRPQIVHVGCSLGSWGVFRDFLTILLSRALFIKSVVHLHGEYIAPVGGVLGKLRLITYRLMFSFAAIIVVLDERSRSAVHSTHRSKNKVTKIPNFINCSSINPIQLGVERKFTCILVAALRREKGVDTILEIAETQPDINFVLVGDAPDGDIDRIRRLTIDRNLEDRFELTGPLEHDMVLQRLAEANVLLFPSHTEGFPMAVLEAMAVGLPVLSSFAGAIPEMIENGKGGWIIPHDDAEEYSAAIDRLKSDPELSATMGTFNRKKTLSYYDYSQVIKTWIVEYDKLLGS